MAYFIWCLQFSWAPQDPDSLKGLSITTSQLQAGMVTHVVWHIGNPQAGRPGCGVWLVVYTIFQCPSWASLTSMFSAWVEISHADQSLALSSSCDSPRPNCKWAVVLRWYPHPSQSTLRRASDSSSLPGSLVAKAGYEKPWSTWEDGNLDYLGSQWGIWRISIHWIRNTHRFLNWHSAVAPLGPPKRVHRVHCHDFGV